MTAAITPVFTLDVTEFQQVLAAVSSSFQTAAATALNRCAVDAMVEQSQKSMAKFHWRNPQFAPPLSPPAKYLAKPDNLAVTVGFAYPDNDPRSLGSRADTVLSPFGQAQSLTAQTPLAPFFSPTTALRPSVDAVVPRSQYPANTLGLVNGAYARQATAKTIRRRIRRHGLGALAEQVGLLAPQVKVSQRKATRDFVLGQPGDPYFGEWQRTGPARRDIRELWVFVEQKRDPKLLDFEADIEASLAAHWQPEMSDALVAVAQGYVVVR